MSETPFISVIIPTYNRADALALTLAALQRQEYPANRFEVIVVDDGSSDHTSDVLRQATFAPGQFRFVQQQNRGVSAARNRGAALAAGDLLLFLSDDLIVEPDFLHQHAAAHTRLPNVWVVGGFKQIEHDTPTPFARFVDALEDEFHATRLGPEVAAGIHEYVITARNLSMPADHFRGIGGFDERMRTTCEDQDLLHRASHLGVTVVYHQGLAAVHNEQAMTLRRYADFQRRGSRDTALLCSKYPELHGASAVARVNGRINVRRDGVKATLKKATKTILARQPVMKSLVVFSRVLEAAHVPHGILRRYYHAVISLHMLRGWREGEAALREAEKAGASE